MNSLRSRFFLVYLLTILVFMLALTGSCFGGEIPLKTDAFLVSPGTHVSAQTVVSIPVPRERVFESYLELEVVANSDIYLEVGCFFDSEYFVLDNNFITKGSNIVRLDITRGMVESYESGISLLDLALMKRDLPEVDGGSWFAIQDCAAQDVCGKVFIQSLPAYSVADKKAGISRRLRDHGHGETFSAEQQTKVANRSLMIAPNPFNPSTEIIFYNAVEEEVGVEVFDLRGAHVATIAREIFPVGENHIHWDGRYDGGANASSGLYFVKVVKQSGVETGRMLLVR